MEFRSERAALSALSEAIIKSGVSLFNAVKYIYAIADEDFYNISVKDIIKVALNNITDTNILQNTGIRIAGRCKEMSTPEFEKSLSLIVYSFAARTPILKTFKHNNDALTDVQIKAVYEIVCAKGANNDGGVVPEEFDEIRRLIKGGKQIPAYTAEWFKAFIYTKIPELSTITNKNMFLLGSVDILFTLFYSCLEEELHRIIVDNCG